VAENPFLKDFYRRHEALGLPLQVFFLTSRAKGMRAARRSRSVVQDRSLYEDAEVFARNLWEQGP